MLILAPRRKAVGDRHGPFTYGIGCRWTLGRVRTGKSSVPGFESCMLSLRHSLENAGSLQRQFTYEISGRKDLRREKAAKVIPLGNIPRVAKALSISRSIKHDDRPCTLHLLAAGWQVLPVVFFRLEKRTHHPDRHIPMILNGNRRLAQCGLNEQVNVSQIATP